MWRRVNLFLRSSIFFVYSSLGITICSSLCVVIWPIPLKYRHAFMRSYLHSTMLVLKYVCNIRYTVSGLSHIPKDQVGVVLSKHQSTWETFFLPLIFHQPAIILKRELLWIPFFGWGVRSADPIAINRNDASSAMQQIITKGTACLKQGRWVLVFPEGTRIPSGQVGHYRLGGARLAVASGYPVIPVAHNAGRYWPKRKFIKYPGVIHVAIGPPIDSSGRKPEEVLALTRDWIETTMREIDPDSYRTNPPVST